MEIKNVKKQALKEYADSINSVEVRNKRSNNKNRSF